MAGPRITQQQETELEYGRPERPSDAVAKILTSPCADADARGALLDRDAGLHAFASPAVVGRDPGVAQIALLHDSVSRRHARIALDEQGAWTIADLESTNGTFVDGRRAAGLVPLRDQQVLVFGHVALTFVALRQPGQIAASTSLEILAAATGAPLVRYRASCTAVGADELTLLEHLAGRWKHEARAMPAERGFVRSAELGAVLGRTGEAWTVASLRALVASVRRQLARVGADQLFEVNERLGYRLRASLQTAVR